jgi:hypothetical protein
MNDSKQTITRYLLGELSEGEQSALEERYFADPRVFDAITAAEAALVDDYVRGKLSAAMRARFEQTYLADPRRRNRVRFAEVLATRLDQAAAAQPSGHAVRQPAEERKSEAGWWSWIDGLWASKWSLGGATATVLIVATGIWLAIQSRQVRQESAQEQARAPELERSSPKPADPPPPETRPSPEEPRRPSFATLVLTVRVGERGQDGSRPPTLIIPPGTSDVRVQLRLSEHEYASYQVVLRAVGGPEILRRANVRPVADGPNPVLTLSVPASRFSPGDYILTLRGADAGGELDDLSQSLFRVEEKR